MPRALAARFGLVLCIASAPAAARTSIPAPTPVIDDLVAQVKAAELMAEVNWLVDLGVRYSFSPNILVVADSLEAKLATYGLHTEQHEFDLGRLPVTNVIGTRPGRTHPDSVFVFCAHYDATSENALYHTPGADDNASGVVAVLTAARLLAPLAVDYTVQFVLFAGEEQGLIGSDAWVAEQAAAGTGIVGALNFDMIAWWAPGVPCDLEIETDEPSRWLADTVAWAADRFTQTPCEVHVVPAAEWGDFASFWRYGYAAVNHEESVDWNDPDFNPWYHTGLDTPESLAPEFFAGNVKVAVAALAALARAARLADVPATSPTDAILTAGPNPFNGRVELRLAASAADGPQQVAVYDVRGRRVALLTAAMRGGRGTATWDACDDRGRAAPAGVYLARAVGLPGRPSCRLTYLP